MATNLRPSHHRRSLSSSMATSLRPSHRRRSPDDRRRVKSSV
ncbi:hypothetical protein LINPERHAP1_LOCUS21030 [Linum perenne]